MFPALIPLRVFLLVITFAFFAKAQEIQIERDVTVPMRDGAILRADVYRPVEGGPYPVIVSRTPYGKHGLKLEKFARAGYIAVAQDVRGRYKSEGEFESFVRFETHDAEDGYDTVEWAAKLPGSTGKVGTQGGSYNAFLQWRLAPLRPPSLVAMAASSIPTRHADLEGPGALRPGRRLNWWQNTISPDLHRRTGTPSLKGERLDKILNFIPRIELPDSIFATEADAVKFWLKNPHLDPWQLDKGCRDISVPNLDIIGWFDHCNGSIDLHRAMRKEGKTKIARDGQRMIIGPWSHAGRGARKVGGIDFGSDAALDLVDTEIRWFDYWLKGKTNGVNNDAPVKIFVMGANQWRDEQEWPLKRATKKELFLSSGGKANTPAGDGKLVTKEVRQSGSDEYVYDPCDPVPTLWAQNMFTVPADQKPLAHRQDILVYQTEPLTEALEVTGYPEVVLYAASTAPDTDFFARLIDVAPDGTTRDIAMGMVRARYRNSLEKPKLLKAGEVTKFAIRLRPTSNEFQAGHRIRFDITSSDFPNYERNHNTATNQNLDATLVVAGQSIHHGGKFDSKLILPVISKVNATASR